MRVSVVIPTYNEAQSISLVPISRRQWSNKCLSSTAIQPTEQHRLRAKWGPLVLHEPRRGYGRACLTGLAAVNAPDVVVFLDGDYSDRPAEISRLLEPLRQGAADIVIGSRLAGERMAGSMPWHAVAGNRLAARLIAILSGVRLTDLGPFRAVRSAGVELRSLWLRWRIAPVPECVPMAHDGTVPGRCRDSEPPPGAGAPGRVRTRCAGTGPSAGDPSSAAISTGFIAISCRLATLAASESRHPEAAQGAP
jgi:hypothetical protein